MKNINFMKISDLVPLWRFFIPATKTLRLKGFTKFISALFRLMPPQMEPKKGRKRRFPSLENVIRSEK
jgi:hypothetical protein